MDSLTFKNILDEISCKLNEGFTEERKVTVTEYFQKVYSYNVYDGKQNRAKAMVNTYKYLECNPSYDSLHKAFIIGACIEIFQASFLVLDDIMDNSMVRRNKKCWYLIGKESGCGLISVNDGLYLNALVNKILHTYLKKELYYSDLLDLFADINIKTIRGQCLDMLSSNDVIVWEKYTRETYLEIVKWKTAYYSFYLPVAAAMILKGIENEQSYKTAEKILLKIGEYFQIQDDYLDCYGSFDKIGKIGRDIEEGKCCWLIINALEIGSDKQIRLLKDNYGQEDPNKVKIVKKIYDELNMTNAYLDYEACVYKEVMNMIGNLPTNKNDDMYIPKEIFTSFFFQIYKRTN